MEEVDNASAAVVNGGALDEDKDEKCRRLLPVPQPEKNNANFWYFLKQCVGKELTKITMPVAWNEPLSLLQRISENVSYARLLKAGSSKSDPAVRMEYVAAFAVSSLSGNFDRMGKPFNPLLGETFQLQQNDFRVLCEQVGHHPPVSAFYADNTEKDFAFHGSIYPKVKFWGKSLEFQPKGTLTVKFPKIDDEVYTWTNVNCTIHNIIVGSLWMEHTGTMEILNHITKHKCVLTFKPGGWFGNSGDLHSVEGFILDREKKKLKFIYGRWNEFLATVDIPNLEDYFKIKAEKIDSGATNLPKHGSLNAGDIPGSDILWKVDPKPKDCDKYYNFSYFTMKLNELKTSEDIASTDCRLRPDIRALENGLLDLAASEKERLENKQREYRKPFKNKKEYEWWNPRWFMNCKHDFTKEDDWKYIGGFWEGEYKSNNKDLPDIF